jgi:parallel beta-helix repeat protein
MRRWRLSLFAVPLVLLAINATATERYVALSGNDANAGTLASPYKTITKAASVATAGDVISVRGGTYSERVSIYSIGTANARITFRAYPGEKVILDGAAVPANKAVVTMSGTQYVDFSGFEVRNGPYIGVLMWEAKQTRVLNNDIHDMVRGGVWAGADAPGICSDLTVSGNTIHNNVLENQYHNMGGGGWAGAVVVSVTDRSEISGNRIYNNDGEGIIAHRGNTFAIRDNEIFDNFSVELYVDNGRYVTAERNLIYNTGNPRYLRDGYRSSGISIANETAANMNPSSDNTFVNNIVVGTRWGFYYGNWESGGGLRNTKVVNNTFYGTTEALVEIEDDAHANNVIENNIFVSTGGRTPRYVGTPATTYRNNLWYGGNAGPAAGAGDVLANPMFVNPGGLTAADYRIKLGSGAIAAAYDASSVLTSDYFGATRALPFDIGAHQLSVASTDTIAPSVPLDLRATNGLGNSLTIAWSPSTDNVGVTSYTVLRDGVVKATVTLPTWTDPAVTEGTSYSYQVRANDAAGNHSALSIALKVAQSSSSAGADRDAPSAPTRLVASSSTTTVDLGWQFSNDNVGVKGYRVYRDGTLVGTVTKNVFRDSGLHAGTTYLYAIAAYDLTGNQSAQSTISVQTRTTRSRAARH